MLLFVITLIGTFLRFYKLDKYQIQLNHDEISQIYDTVSIVKTGKDIYGNFLPLAFPSTGDFKVGHYIYITVLFYLIFGMKEITIRLPAAFFGVLIIPAVFLFIKKLTRNWKIAIVSAAMIAITPSEIFYARKSFENVIGAFFVYIGFFYLLKSIENKIKNSDLLFASLFMALPMYLYTSYTIVSPLVIIAYSIIFWKKIIADYKKFLMMLIIWIILIVPLVLIILGNPNVRFRAGSVSVFHDVYLTKQLEPINISSPIINWLYRTKVILEYIFVKYLYQFDPSIIFAKGLDLTNQDLIGLGPLLFIQLPFFFLGIIYIIKSNLFVNYGKFLFVLLFLSMIPSSLTLEVFSPHRSILAFSLMSIISAFGLYWVVRRIRISVIFLVVWLFFVNLFYFLHIYTVNFPYEKSQQIHYPYKDVAVFAWSNYDKFDQIIIDPIYGQTAPVQAVAVHYYLAYYGNYDPAKLQADLRTDKEGIHFSKFFIRKIDWIKDQNLKNTLMIASPWSIPNSIEKDKVLKTFTYYDKSVAFQAIKL